MFIFAKSTDRLRRVFKLAGRRAKKMRHGTIQPLHVLLGLVDENGGVGCRVLKNLSISDGDMQRLAIEQLSHVPEAPVPVAETPIEEAPFGYASVPLLDAIHEISRSMTHNCYGTGHLLVALFDVPSTERVLTELGLSRKRVYDETLLLLGQDVDPSGAGGDHPNADR